MATLAAQHVGHPDLPGRMCTEHKPVTTALARLGLESCATPPVCQIKYPFPPSSCLSTRTEVSSEQTTSLAITVSRIAAAASSNGSRARASMLLIAPSLIERANNSPIKATNRSIPMAWASCRYTTFTAIDWPNGEPCSSPLGVAAGHTLAATSAATAKQTHMRHIRLDRRQLDALVQLAACVCCSAGKTAAQWGQTSSLASTTRSGFGSSARPTPGRLLRAELCAGWTIALRTPRRWQRRIVGVLRRPFEHGQSCSNSVIRASAASN